MSHDDYSRSELIDLVERQGAYILQLTEAINQLEEELNDCGIQYNSTIEELQKLQREKSGRRY